MGRGRSLQRLQNTVRSQSVVKRAARRRIFSGGDWNDPPEDLLGDEQALLPTPSDPCWRCGRTFEVGQPARVTQGGPVHETCPAG